MYHCIVNPDAGRRSGKEWAYTVKSFMNEHGKDVAIKEAQSAAEASQWVHQACLADSEGIIAVGGDGTVQAIVTGMLQNVKKCETPLGIISCGSGNDLVRSFGYWPKNEKGFLPQIIKGKQRTIDAIRVNDKACLNIANIGLDVRIVRNSLKYKQFLGKRAYLASAFVSIALHENIHLRIQIYDEGRESEIEGPFTLAAICNGQYYGGGMRITPPAQIDDGHITLCLVSALSRAKVLVLFPAMLLERHTNLKAVRFIQCQRCIITPQEGETLCIDGNLIECAAPLEFELLPGAIKVFWDC